MLYCLESQQVIDAPRTFRVHDGSFMEQNVLIEHNISNTTDEYDLNIQPDPSGRDEDYRIDDHCTSSGENESSQTNAKDVEDETIIINGSDGVTSTNNHLDDQTNTNEDMSFKKSSSSLRSLQHERNPYVTLNNMRSYESDIESEHSSTEVSMMALNELTKFMPSEVPKSFVDAWSDPDWKEAILKEWNCLLKHKTWKTPSSNASIRNVIGCKWIFKIKRNHDGMIVKHKARLVAQGYSQKYGIDYDETYAPVATKRSLRCFLAYAAKHNLYMEQMDIETAFLSGDIDRQMFMKAPQGFESKVGKVVELTKSIYGLKQAPRIFYQKLENALRRIGFIQSRVDSCIYVKDTMRLLVYVDDLLFASTEQHDNDSIYTKLSQEFTLVRMGKPRFILGCEIQYVDTGFIMKQSQYIRNLCKAYQVENSKCPKTPIEANLDLHLDKTKEIVNAPFGSLLGGLLYIACCTRPDIATAVSVLGQVCANPTSSHWKYLKRILKYLQGTIDHGLLFEYGNHENVIGYCDANWGGCMKTSRSRSGVVCTYNRTPVYWRSRKQSCVSLSSCEAEYYSISCGAKEILETNKLIFELENGQRYEDTSQMKAVMIYEDNQSCIKSLQNDIVPPNLRHIRIRYHWIKEKIQSGDIKIAYVDTKNQLADCFSKCLGPSKFQQAKLKLVKCSRELGSVGLGTSSSHSSDA